MNALHGALTTRSSEVEQPLGGGEAVAKARAGDAFFVDSQKNAWLQRATTLRQNITTLYLRERTVERQTGPWAPPPASTVAVATPSVSAPPAAVPAAPSRGRTR